MTECKPWLKYANGLEGPEYTVIKEAKEYEIREYKSHIWTASDEKLEQLGTFLRTPFNRLFKYISGENDAKTKVEMTCPVLMHGKPTEGGSGLDMSMHFYAPDMYQVEGNPPPKPTDPAVYNVTLPPMTLAVFTFGGWMTAGKVENHLKKLKEYLDRDGVKYESKEGEYWFGGYDSPFRLFNRHNEVYLKVIS